MALSGVAEFVSKIKELVNAPRGVCSRRILNIYRTQVYMSAVIFLLLCLIQPEDREVKELIFYVEQKYNSDTTFKFQKLTTFPESKDTVHYWNCSYVYNTYRFENIVYKLGSGYVVGLRFTFRLGNKTFYLYQADLYEKQNSWVQKRKTKIIVEASDRYGILFYKDLVMMTP